MIAFRLLAIAALSLSAAAAQAQSSDLPPERAPAAQQFAPPSQIAPPINSESDAHFNPASPATTTGQAPKPGPADGESNVTNPSDRLLPDNGPAKTGPQR